MDRKVAQCFCGKDATHAWYNTGPGIGIAGDTCDEHFNTLNWESIIGLDYHNRDPNAKLVEYIVNTRYKTGNAYGSILALYDDGTRLGITCGHGGSEWLCVECAHTIMKEQDERNP